LNLAIIKIKMEKILKENSFICVVSPYRIEKFRGSCMQELLNMDRFSHNGTI
jgi:hypothetical protein